MDVGHFRCATWFLTIIWSLQVNHDKSDAMVKRSVKRKCATERDQYARARRSTCAITKRNENCNCYGHVTPNRSCHRLLPRNGPAMHLGLPRSPCLPCTTYACRTPPGAPPPPHPTPLTPGKRTNKTLALPTPALGELPMSCTKPQNNCALVHPVGLECCLRMRCMWQQAVR